MTGRYEYIPPDGKHHCVPTCLQMILQSRGIPYDSQNKMLRDLGSKGDGVRLPEGQLERYFISKGIPLHCIDLRADHSFCKDFEDFAEAVLKKGGDVMVSYAIEDIFRNKKEDKHVSLIVARKGMTKLTLLDANVRRPITVSICKLIDAMFKVGGGYHCMHPDLEVLKALKGSW